MRDCFAFQAPNGIRARVINCTYLAMYTPINR